MFALQDEIQQGIQGPKFMAGYVIGPGVGIRPTAK